MNDYTQYKESYDRDEKYQSWKRDHHVHESHDYCIDLSSKETRGRTQESSDRHRDTHRHEPYCERYSSPVKCSRQYVPGELVRSQGMKQRRCEHPFREEASLSSWVEGRKEGSQKRNEIKDHHGHGRCDRYLTLPECSPRQGPLTAGRGRMERFFPPLLEEGPQQDHGDAQDPRDEG